MGAACSEEIRENPTFEVLMFCDASFKLELMSLGEERALYLEVES
jgi:hypothetical protein